MTDADSLYLAEWEAERDTDPTGDWTDPGDDLWHTRPVLTHIHTFAQARRAGPWAVLGVTLARVVTLTPPWVVLPALTGTHASLNLYVGLVGPSGAGKGAAEGAAHDALDTDEDITTVGAGSGEGLAHLFAARKRGGELEQHTTAVMLSVPEIDTLTALGSRYGATLLPELRKAWSGERIGFAYADHLKRLPIKAHTYRLTMVTGIQPRRAAGILGDSDAGTPQRFLWLPATDPTAPAAAPETPTPWGWKPPAWPMSDMAGRVVLPVCRRAVAVMDAHRLASLRGTTGDALDAHGPLARLKVAAALALLDGHVGVTDEDWDLSLMVMTTSDQTRQRVVAALRQVEDAKNRQRAEFDATRAVIVDERIQVDKVRKAAQTLKRRLARESDWLAGGELRRALASWGRPYFEPAIESLILAGEIESRETGVDRPDRRGVEYKIRGP